ncbi:MAG: hypothetical protein AAEJ65_06380 [Planctomycetota bacterium]
MEQNSIFRPFLAFLFIGAITVVYPSTALSQALFIRGDCNIDNSLDIADAILGLGILFSGAGPAACDDACDVNDDGSIDISDPISLLSNLFNSGPNPPPPNNCGDDPTTDSLDCQNGPLQCVLEDCSNGIDDDGDGLIDCFDPDCAADPACISSLSFANDIYPIIDFECVFCHGPPAPFGNLDMSGGAAAGYDAIVNVMSGECPTYVLVSPDDSQSSWLFRKIEGTHVEAATAVGCDALAAGGRMPFGPFCCLTAFEIELIRGWIDSGANP